VNWTREQWNKILWTDETWVTSKYHRRIYVTRKAGEEFDETCTRERINVLGGGGLGKRKRSSNSTASIKRTDRSINGSKHKRALSTISHDGAPERILRDDLLAKLSTMQDMLSSTRTVSVLTLRGDMEDDPDLYPIRLPTDGDFVKEKPSRRQNTDGSHSMGALVPSLISSNVSLDLRQAHPSQPVSSKNPTIVQKITSHDTNISPQSIKAVDINPEYRPPMERPPKPSKLPTVDIVTIGADVFHSRMFLMFDFGGRESVCPTTTMQSTWPSVLFGIW